MSTLCAVLGLFFASLAIKKLVKEPPATELPKVKEGMAVTRHEAPRGQLT